MTITFSEIVNKVHSSQLKQNPANLAALFNVNVKPSQEDFYKGSSDAAKIAKDIAKAAAKNGSAALVPERSLSEYTRTANVEPRVMLEDTLKNLPNLDKFLMTLTNLYSAYYLQAIALSAEIKGVSVLSRLDKFNPNRNLEGNIIDALQSAASESIMEYGYKLPNYKKPADISFIKPSQAALEVIDTVTTTKTTQSNKNEDGSQTTITTTTTDDNKPEVEPVNSSDIKAGLRKISDVDNLAVGRLLEVSLIIDGKTFTVPVAVRMRPMAVPSLIMRELVALGDIRESWRERWHRMRAGELKLVSDWIFQSDRIRNLRKLIKLDKQGLYREMLERRRNNRASAAITGNASIGSASSFIIISKQTAKEVEYRTGMPIESEVFRKRIFEENSAMMLIVVDTEWERLQCYTRGITGVADYSFKQFEGMSKGNGPDISEIMKAYTLGNNPRF